MNRALNIHEDGREFGQPMGVVPRKVLISAVLAAFIIGIIVGMLLGHYAMIPERVPHAFVTTTPLAVSDADLFSRVDAESISGYLQNLTSQPHLAGTPEDLEQAQWLESHFKRAGFDQVQIVPYNVLLSYPNESTPNEIFILSEQGDIVYRINDSQPALYPGEEKFKIQTFNAYSGHGIVEAYMVYVNYGREEDFQYLNDNGVSVKGNVVLARLGQIFRANIVKFAEQYGAKGVIFFMDPKDFGPPGKEGVYPDTVYLPPLGAQSGTVKLTEGDPLTPHFPSIKTAYRIAEKDALLPKIPVQPIGYQDAQELLRTMAGTKPSPTNWTGGLNCSYEIGPSRQAIRMKIQTTNEQRVTYNVIAVMHGRVESDRYVILGNHRDAWTFGGVDPSSGTALLMELGRVFGQLKKDHAWLPRRSLVLCSWGAEEHGLVGSMEWTEDLRKLLDARAVAYINVDMAMSGNVTLMGESVPLLYTALFNAAKKVKNPNKFEYDHGMKTLYDSWLHHMPDNITKNRPEVKDIGSGSDYVGFIHNLGIPSADVRFIDPKYHDTYPLYHTLYDTYHLVKDLMDNGFHLHVALAKVWGEMARDLADSLILPFNATEYAAYLSRALDAIKEGLGPKLSQKGLSLGDFEEAIQEFSHSAIEFQNSVLPYVDKSNPLAVRAVNDRLMLLERAFINPWGLPMGRNDVNHVVFAPSSSDSYAGTSFAGLWDLLHNVDRLNSTEQAKRWEGVKKHLSEVIFYVKRAATVLKGDITAV